MASPQTTEERIRFFALLDSFEQCNESDIEIVNDSQPKSSRKRPRLDSPIAFESPRKARCLNNAKRIYFPVVSNTVASDDPQKAAVSVPKARATSADRSLAMDKIISTDHGTSTRKRADFIPNSDISKPRKLRIQSTIAHGAIWSREINTSVTHVIVDAGIEYNSALKAFPGRHVPAGIAVVKDNWISECLGYKVLRDTSLNRFRLRGAPEPPVRAVDQKQSTISSSTQRKETRQGASPQHHRRSTRNSLPATQRADALDTILEELKGEEQPLDAEMDVDVLLSMERKSDSISSSPEIDNTSYTKPTYHCLEKNDGSGLSSNPNKRTVEILQQMATYYDRVGDNWRTVGYRKAISALRKQTDLICTRSQALAIYGIGSRLADKIEEIVTTDRLRRLEATSLDPDDRTLQLFMGIYGVGYKQARLWIGQGYRDLDDLRKYARLTANHKVGIAHYDDFLQRIPRREVEQHANIVKRALRSVDAKLQAIVGGSYRRGSQDSGDVDILITKEGAGLEEICTLMIESVIPKLTKFGFLKHALAATDGSKDTGSKWHGASALPGSTIWRRLDLLFVPWDELGAALIYFTGNDIFNRSIRLLASRKGMRLNQHGLYANVLRGKGRTKITDGELLAGHSEKEIFDILEVPWRPPEHRRC